MSERPGLVSSLVQIDMDQLRDTGEWFLYTTLGSLVPVWGGVFLYAVFSDDIPWLDFTAHGEFALYSAAWLAPALYVIVREGEGLSFPRRGLFVLASVALLLCSVLIFAGITVLADNNLIKDVNEMAIATWSLLLFGASAVIAVLVKLVDNLRRAPPVAEISARRQEALEERFDELE